MKQCPGCGNHTNDYPNKIIKTKFGKGEYRYKTRLCRTCFNLNQNKVRAERTLKRREELLSQYAMERGEI